MKKLLIVILITLVLLIHAYNSFAGSKSSGVKTADGVITSASCILTAVTILDDGTNSATLILYDHASAASGNVVFKMKAGGGDNSTIRDIGTPINCALGLYADVTTSGTVEFLVEYVQK